MKLPKDIDVFPDVSLMPFVGLLGKTEAEVVTGLFVAYMADRDNTWDPIDIGHFTTWSAEQARLFTTPGRLYINPFIRPKIGLKFLEDRDFIVRKTEVNNSPWGDIERELVRFQPSLLALLETA